ncbi:hypothetical protein [Halomonas saccharevitans]|uniref:Uncharacterized protein n=1 Tax=Halomonas saccharevitans TaxID=416872 RepID=A0A1I7BWM0_9GAMM|nr:hypothetical protein [Halomonas saccharevitans]SFT91540.1 hypothetical protein SAMN04487956_13123 [Halomonas saccharevitans]
MRKVELRPLETNQPGYARLVLIGWQGPSEGLSVDIQRNQDENFLQDDGEWRNHACQFPLPPLQADVDGNLAAIVDRQIVDPLLENPHATNMARLHGADGIELGMARIRLSRDLLPSGAGGSTPSLNTVATPNAAEPTPEPEATPDKPAPTEPAPTEPEPTEPEPIEPQPDEPKPAEPTPTPAATPEPTAPAVTTGKGKRWPWIVLAVVLLIAILGAAAWFGMSMRDADDAVVESDAPAESTAANDEPLADSEIADPEETPDPLNEDTAAEQATEERRSDDPAPAEPAPSEASTAAAGPCSLQRMGEMGELEFIQACTGAENSGDDMLNVVNEALANDHCGVARRLYAHRALNGDADAALNYAQEFDPAQHSPSTCFPEPDAETAIFWYETALGLDADNAEASQRLQELQG